MTKLNDKLIAMSCSAQTKTAGMQRAINKHGRLINFMFVVISCITMMFSMACLTFAATGGSDISGAIAGGMDEFYKVLRSVAIPVAVVAFVAAAFCIFTGGEKGMEKAKKIMLYTAIGVAVALLGPLLIKTVAKWFQTAEHTVEKFNN